MRSPRALATGLYLTLQACSPTEALRDATPVIEARPSSSHPDQGTLTYCAAAAKKRTSGVLEQALGYVEKIENQNNEIKICLSAKDEGICTPNIPTAVFEESQRWTCTNSNEELPLTQVWRLAAPESEQEEWEKEDRQTWSTQSKECKQGNTNKELECVGQRREEIEVKRAVFIMGQHPGFTSCEHRHTGDVLKKDFSQVWVCLGPSDGNY